ncbi:photosystem I assembly protein Ycf3 [Novipirellula aureliae]|uniref:Photosystem I assembly protein Ycf3 n=1 Tax=Novipirellula aureliae TaxID=2527966 RepID=A0A5C6ECA6_9BACT|nr:tetratricopeptide repeat protein [Novipirellula aureliae]TWU45567.1 photosystem I assembly protein Ycf3 [Novipirellula aureliae]
MASMNPFSRSPVATDPATGPASPSVTESIASTTSNAGKSIEAMGASAKTAFGKTSDAFAGVFRRDKTDEINEISDTDPLKLTDKPADVGPDVFVANGQLWESTGNFTKAMESYNKALERDPKDVPTLTSIARLNFRQGNHPEAVTYFQRAIQESPKDAALYNDLGLTLSKTGDHAQAAQMLTQALELSPGTSRYANNLASIRFEAGDKQGAFKVLQDNNKPAVAHFNMAYLHYSKGQMADSRGHLAEAMKYEAQASTDAAVRRAVDRSREMIAQIDASGNGSGIANIAQATPAAQAPMQNPQAVAQVQATQPAPGATGVAGQAVGYPMTNPTANQVPAATAGYRPGTTAWAPAMASITKPNPTSTQNPPTTPNDVTAPAGPAAVVAGTPDWGHGTWAQKAAANPAPATPATPALPAPPTYTAPTTTLPTSAAPATDTSTAEPFALPNGFTMPSM